MALVPGEREPQILTGDPAPELRLQAVLHDAAAETTGDDARGLEHRHGEQGERGEDHSSGGDLPLFERRDDDPVDDAAEHPGLGDGHGAVDGAAADGDGEDAGFLADGDTEDAEPSAEHRPRDPAFVVAHAHPPSR